jgi:hypothetical protein
MARAASTSIAQGGSDVDFMQSVLDTLETDKNWGTAANGYESNISLSEFFSSEYAFVNAKARLVIDVLNMG